MRTWKTFLTTSLAIGCAALGAACGGDDGGGGDDDVDASTPDAAPDAAPSATRALTISVVDVSVTTPGGAEAGLRGGSITVDLDDLTAGGGQVVYGGAAEDACVVTKYDATHVEHPPVGAGSFNLSNPEPKTPGLRKTVGPCNFQDGSYRCVSNSGTEAIDGQGSSISPLVTYSFENAPFADQDLVGSYLLINGFSSDVLNTGTKARAIVQQTDSTLTVLRTETPATATQLDANATFTVLNGAGPIPTNVGFPVNANFLGDNVDQIGLALTADDEFGAVDMSGPTRGEGFDLDDVSALPHALPLDAAAHFSCSGTGGNCGGPVDTTSPVIQALVIAGRTTDGNLTDLADYEMPDPTSSYATFRCAFPLGTEGDIPLDAINAILSTNPTRIETRVLIVDGKIGEDTVNPLNGYAVVVGHGLVGHTDVP